MPIRCGRIHLGPLVTGTYLCCACGNVLTNAEMIAYRRVRMRVADIIRDAHLFLVDYLKKQAQ